MSRSISAVHQPIPFARPSIGPAEEAAVLEVLRSGQPVNLKAEVAVRPSFQN